MSVKPSDRGICPPHPNNEAGGKRQEGRILVIIDTHAHVVPGSLIETLRAEPRIFPSVRLVAEGGTTRIAFAGEAPTRPISPRLSDLDHRKPWLAPRQTD